MLSDSYIRKYIFADKSIVMEPEPFDNQIQPCSVDLRLGNVIKKYKDNSWPIISFKNKHSLSMTDVHLDGHQFKLRPNQFVLASTEEYIELPRTISARVEGKSSIGRIGLMVHVTAGFIDPGFKGNITLELKNLNTRPIILERYMPISQICFFRVDGVVQRAYGSSGLGSHYQNSKGTVGPK